MSKRKPTEALLLRITKPQRAALERRRRDSGQAVSAMIREAIDDYLRTHMATTPEALEAQLATVGYVRGLFEELRAELAGQEGGNHGAR